ncbi:MAG: hypothetical protein WC873_03250 [Candidatus Gracilibacteria bacterium]
METDTSTQMTVQKMFRGKEDDLMYILSTPHTDGNVDTRELTQEIRMCLIGARNLDGANDTPEQAAIRKIVDDHRYHINYVLRARQILHLKADNGKLNGILHSTIAQIRRILVNVVAYEEIKETDNWRRAERNDDKIPGVILYFRSPSAVPRNLAQRIKVDNENPSVLEFPDGTFKVEGSEITFVSNCRMKGVLPMTLNIGDLQKIEGYDGSLWEPYQN